MKAYDFVHLVLFAAGGCVKGRTKLQKLAYFAGVLSNHLDDLGYRAHFYGPYSSKVAASVDRLRELGFLEQSQAGMGSVDSRGFEVARYDFRLTDDGKTVAKDKIEQFPNAWKLIKAAVRKIEQGKADYVKLSIAAKTYYLLQTSPSSMKSEPLKALSRRFGWVVSEKELQEAIEWLKSVGVASEDNC